MGDFWRAHGQVHGAVVVAMVYDLAGDLSNVAVFSTMAKAMQWADEFGGDMEGECVLAPFVTDMPEFGNSPARLQ